MKIELDLIHANLVTAMNFLDKQGIAYLCTGDGWITVTYPNLQFQIKSYETCRYALNVYAYEKPFTFYTEHIKQLENNILFLTKML